MPPDDRYLRTADGRSRRRPDIRQRAAHRRANLMRAHLERAPALALKRRDASGDTMTDAAARG